MDSLTFAKSLLDRGIELIIRGKRLHVWPAKAFPYLTTAERDFIREHRPELKELAASHVLPETTVTWTPPSAAGLPVQASPTLEPGPEPTCIYCGSSLSRCVARKATDPDIWNALHSRDPEVIKQKHEYATSVMLTQIGNPYDPY